MDKSSAFYLKHDFDWIDDIEFTKLLNEKKIAGYGIYWMLIEKLGQQPDFKLNVSVIPLLAKKYKATKKDVFYVVYETNLFKIEGKYFFSEVLSKKMEEITKQIKRMSEGGKAGYAKKISNLEGNNSSSVTKEEFKGTLSHPSDIIVIDKAIEKVIDNIFIKPSLSEIEDYCRHRSNKIDPEKFFNHYQSRGWCMGKNNTPMSDWKAAIHNWEKNEVNEVKADLGVEEWINESGNRTYGKSGVIVPNEAPPRPSRKHIWSIHDKVWRVNL